MQFTEKTLYCHNCKKPFVFMVEAQEYRSFEGYPNEPTNCFTCRRAGKTMISDKAEVREEYNSSRQMYPVTCTQCGKAVRVPFQPHSGSGLM